MKDRSPCDPLRHPHYQNVSTSSNVPAERGMASLLLKGKWPVLPEVSTTHSASSYAWGLKNFIFQSSFLFLISPPSASSLTSTFTAHSSALCSYNHSYTSAPAHGRYRRLSLLSPSLDHHPSHSRRRLVRVLHSSSNSFLLPSDLGFFDLASSNPLSLVSSSSILEHSTPLLHRTHRTLA